VSAMSALAKLSGKVDESANLGRGGDASLTKLRESEPFSPAIAPGT